MTPRGGSVHTCWVTTSRANIECSVTSSMEQATADPSQALKQESGVVSRWRNSGASSYWMARGEQNLTRPSVASDTLKSTPTIIQIRRMGNEKVAEAGNAPFGFGEWRSSWDYGVRAGRGEPRGRKFDGNSGADSPTSPARTEGGKRFCSLIRNP